MLHRTLNLGILAHVDAGKTTLTERLLFDAGAIGELGRVDAGTTQTDTLALERRRGITIRSAVASFAIGDLHVNLIDTPGHPDFIAEVERVLLVLDGAVLVISAVEGVQPQTRILMRALQRLRIPTLIFINKTDRTGADPPRVLREITTRLTTAAAPAVEVLAEHDDALLAAYVDGTLSEARMHDALVAQTARALVHPVFAGSALTGDGIAELTAGIAELLPVSAGDPEGPPLGTVFKIERGPSGERIAYVRLFSGTIRVRDVVRGEKVTKLSVFGGNETLAAGQVGKLWGLHEIQVGDRIGEGGADTAHEFPPPTLESVVVPREPGDGARLRDALGQLAEQDPLIDVRHDGPTLTVSLYGEVQKEVLEATLADDYGLAVDFRETTPIYIERPTGVGEAVEILHADTNPYHASIGLRIEPAPDESGVAFRLDISPLSIPLYIYKTHVRFEEHMTEYVRSALRVGLQGWRVSDCVVTMTQCMYSVPDGPPSRRGPLSTAADFRKLTPIVLAQALARAGTVVCEPIVRARVEAPVEAIGAVIAAVARLGGELAQPELVGALARLQTVIPATRAHDLHRELPGLTGGEGVLESDFAGYRPLRASSARPVSIE